MRPALVAALSVAVLVAPAAAQDATAERLRNDPRVEALQPYGQPIPPVIRSDKSVQFGKALRVRLKGSKEFWRVGVTTPLLKPVKNGDRIVIAFWARASGTENGGGGRIGQVQLEATPVIRTIFGQGFDIGPEWKMYKLEGAADRDYPPGALNAAMHLDAVKQVLDLGPLFVLDYGHGAP
jgi:hypothetical protein